MWRIMWKKKRKKREKKKKKKIKIKLGHLFVDYEMLSFVNENHSVNIIQWILYSENHKKEKNEKKEK
jgi:hypothetical protein